MVGKKIFLIGLLCVLLIGGSYGVYRYRESKRREEFWRNADRLIEQSKLNSEVYRLGALEARALGHGLSADEERELEFLKKRRLEREYRK